jgi:ABC-type transport system involved in multi-copper enzyme maturation permease subunit
MTESTIQTINNEEVNSQQNLVQKYVRKNSGMKQILRTMKFEFSRNFKKLIGLIIMNTLICVLFLVINILQDNNPETAASYATSYLSMISFIVIITGILLGASMIVEDFEKQTGNLLFPKISKDRLFVGRYISRFIYAAIAICVFYLEIAALTLYNYETIPEEFWGSMGWAILYTHLVLSFVVLMSSLLNRIATATVVSILFLLIVFNMIPTILTFTESTIEPLFVLTYYSNIITSWFNMPTERFQEISFGRPGQANPDARVFTSWSTPSWEGMVIGCLIYSTILLIGAYLVYRRKQSNNT